jgi:hypothetical protein
MITSAACPACGAAIHVERTVIEEPMMAGFQRIDEPFTRRTRLALVAFCIACDFAAETKTMPPIRKGAQI